MGAAGTAGQAATVSSAKPRSTPRACDGTNKDAKDIANKGMAHKKLQTTCSKTRAGNAAANAPRSNPRDASIMIAASACLVRDRGQKRLKQTHPTHAKPRETTNPVLCNA